MDGTSCSNLLEELMQYQERLSVALRSAGICVFEVDLARQLYTFFENSEAIFGVDGKTILADVQPFSKLPPEQYQKAVMEYFSHPQDALVINAVFSQIFLGHSASYYARMRAGHSQYIWCKIDVAPVMQNGVPQRMIGAIIDISALHTQAESLEQAAKLEHFTGLYAKSPCQQLIREALLKKNRQNGVRFSLWT